MMCGGGEAVWLSCAVAAVLLLTAQGRGSDTDGHRDKRSDDLGAVQAVLATQAQKLSMLEAELQSTKAELQSTKAAQQSTHVDLQSTKAELLSTKAELQSELQSTKTELQSTKAELQSTKTEVQSSKAAQQSTHAELQSAKASLGSSFVRWGRSTCPALNGTRLLYSGFAGGTRETSQGGGANRICLTKEPVFDDTQGVGYYDLLNGVEYYLPGHLHTDALCAVCHTPQSVTYMVPVTNRCPVGSMEQYHGWLTAGDPNLPASSEFLCLDAAPEDRPGSQGPQDSAYFDQVKAHCGALPCPPYAEGKLVTCVVCSV